MPYERLLQIIISGMLQNKAHIVAGFITDAADNLFGSISDIIINTNDTGLFFSAEERRFWPADIIRNPIFQKSSFDELFAIRIRYFTQFNFVIDFQSSV